MPKQICGGCSSQEYDSSTCGGVEICDIVAEKLMLSFHIPSKTPYSSFGKISFSRGISHGSDKLKKSSVLPAYLGQK